MIYTSYFAQWKKVPRPIAISRSVPKWYEGEKNIHLAPSMKIVLDLKDKKITEREYVELYLSELCANGITIDKLLAMLPDECTLLCWEKSGEFCHRHVVAWILKKAGVVVEEWKQNEAKTT